MIKKIAIGGVGVLAAGIAIILAVATTKPDTFRVQRMASINAPPEKVFALVNDLDRWQAWSPYEKKDPAMKRSRSGPAAGKGAVYAWEGNGEVGKGRMVIADASPPSRVTIDLEFEKPFEARNVVVFTMEPKGDATDVTWAMQGPAPLISKILQVFCDMDAMVGTDFEAGLANLKKLAET
jgi:uncharacterized protein YndB with AHSA1/START domain